MKLITKISIIAAIAVVSTIAIVSVTLGSDNHTLLGKIYKQANTEKSQVVAKVNGKEIKSNSIEAMINSFELTGQKKSKKEIIEKIVIDELLLQQAEQNNIVISDEELNSVLEQLKDNFPRDEEGYKNFKNTLNGMGISEDEYWDMARPVYKKVFTIGKFKNKILRQDFLAKNTDIPEHEKNDKFEEYYLKYKKDLLDKNNIEIYLE